MKNYTNEINYKIALTSLPTTLLFYIKIELKYLYCEGVVSVVKSKLTQQYS